VANVNRFLVSQPSSGTWGVRAPGALQFESVHDTQAEAMTEARAVVHTLGGGGQVYVLGTDGRWHEADSDTDDHAVTATGEQRDG
jgi:hypothetical protein